MTLLIATGLRREAAILARAGVVVIAGGGDTARLEAALEEAAGPASAILSCGIAGALDPALRTGDVVIGGALAERLRLHLPGAHRGLIIGSDVIAATVTQKRALREATGAIAVDMESHIAARVAARHGLPFGVLRVISDRADEALPPAALVGMKPDGGMALGAVLASLARHPGQLGALIRTGMSAGQAFRGLRQVARILGRLP